jgi:hypothetical protein
MNQGLHARHHSSSIASPLDLFEAHEAIKTLGPKPAGAIGFIPSDFSLLGLPHLELDTNHYQRNGGLVQMSMVADPRFGLPFGRVGRLLLIWLTTQAVIQKSSLIDLGASQSEFFVQKLGLSDTGGKNGSINRYSDQLNRLLHTLFTMIDQRREDQRFMHPIVAHRGPIFSIPSNRVDAYFLAICNWIPTSSEVSVSIPCLLICVPFGLCSRPIRWIFIYSWHTGFAA